MKSAWFDASMHEAGERKYRARKRRERAEFFRKHWDLIGLSVMAFASAIALVAWKVF